MKIQCENCGTQHELDPPSWVVSSGRAFRFRCSACGHSQSVQPEAPSREGAAFAAPTEVPAARVAAPTNPTLSPPDDGGRPSVRSPAPAPAPGPTPLRLPEPPIPSMPPPALIESMAPAPDRGLVPAAAADRATAPTQPPVEEPPSEVHTGAVYLKQNGQIYMVRDWETMKRWIVERRVDENDLVSEGGVRWEPIGSRNDLGPLFRTGTPVSASRNPASAAPVSIPAPTPFPFGGDTPFSGGTSGDAPWSDDDTEGIPTGLPPLPTEDSSIYDAGAQALPPALPDEGPPPIQAHQPLRSYPPDEPSSGEYVVRPSPADEEEEIIGEDPDTAATESPVYVPPVEAPRVSPPLVARPSARNTAGSLPRPSGPLVSQASPGTVIAAAVKDGSTDGWEDLLVLPDTAPADLPPSSAPVLREVTDPHRREAPERAADPSTPPPRDQYPFDLEWAEQTRSPARIGRIAFAVLAALTVAAATVAVVVLFVIPQLGSGPPGPVPIAATPHPVPLDVPAPIPVAPVPDPVPVAPPDPVAPDPVAPTPEAPTPEAPTPEPVQPPPVPPKPQAPQPATPTPAAPSPEPAPKAPSVAGLLAKGWESADADPAAAQAVFEQALAKAPSNEEALYGKGYVLLLQGRDADAAPFLCRVREAKDGDIRQDANGMIASHHLSCP